MDSHVQTNRTSRFNWSSPALSTALALGLVFEILGLAAYAYFRLQSALDPNNLADRAEAAIRENYPELREELIEQIQSQAPQIASEVSTKIVTSSPTAREHLEAFTARQIALGLDRATELSADQFRRVLRRNHDTIIAGFQRLEAAPQDAEEFVLQTEASIEDELGVDLQRQAHNALSLHRELNDKLERLVDPDAPLDSQELLERRIVRILKTMQEEPEAIVSVPATQEQRR